MKATHKVEIYCNRLGMQHVRPILAHLQSLGDVGKTRQISIEDEIFEFGGDEGAKLITIVSGALGEDLND